MFRFRLSAVIAVSVCFVLALGAVLYWESNQVAIYFERSQTAHQTFARYQRLSHEAFRHFKQQINRLSNNSPTSETKLKNSEQRLQEALQAVQDRVMQNASATGRAQSWDDKLADLDRLARFKVFLETNRYQFETILHLRKEGKSEQASQALAHFSENEIDGVFQPLIDTAIESERLKAQQASEDMERLINNSRTIAVSAAGLAAIFGLIAGFILLRSVRKPLEALMAGTDEIASGNLSYRIALHSRDEFGYLAKHFNQMASELEQQQDRVRLDRSLLEKRIAERTADLRKVNEELKRLDKARREFFADISHELRTPITVIRGEAEVALRGPNLCISDYQDALQRIVDLSAQLSTYVSDLMFMIRTDNTQPQFDWEQIELRELVGSAAEDLKVIASEYSQSLALQLPEQPIKVRGDKQRLRQVLFILGDNACRYSPKQGHISLSVASNSAQALISIADQGIGIAEEDLPQIFDRHFRGKNAKRSREDGSGLGLPMAKSIIKAHGGDISVRSAEGRGSTFTINLPLNGAT